jgi:carotenoid cleavage dioxygenase-like enzyme
MGVMMHDFAIAENYTIFMDLPVTVSAERMQRGEPMMMFESDRPSRFGIVSRHGDNSNIRWFESPSCYVFHTLNAYEEGDEVILILGVCDRDSVSEAGVLVTVSTACKTITSTSPGGIFTGSAITKLPAASILPLSL